MGSRNILYPFLKTKIPTETARDPLFNPNVPRLEKEVLKYKHKWISSLYPEQLKKIVTQIISDRLAAPISNVVCLGIGGFMSGPDRDLLQFVAFSQIVAQLANANPEILSNIVVQDPMMKHHPRMKALFENHGCRVVEDPEAFELIGPRTFLFSPFVEPMYLLPGLSGRPVEKLAMFVGNGEDMKAQIRHGEPDDEGIIDSMLDDVYCDFEDFPCDRPNGKSFEAEGPMQGLQALEIWWRKERTEYDSVARDKFDFAFNNGFSNTREDFSGPYTIGMGKLSNLGQAKVIYSFIAALYNVSRESFSNYYRSYMGGMTDRQKRYERAVRDCIVEVKDGTYTGRFLDYYASGRKRE